MTRKAGVIHTAGHYVYPVDGKWIHACDGNPQLVHESNFLVPLTEHGNIKYVRCAACIESERFKVDAIAFHVAFDGHFIAWCNSRDELSRDRK